MELPCWWKACSRECWPSEKGVGRGKEDLDNIAIEVIWQLPTSHFPIAFENYDACACMYYSMETELSNIT